MQKISNRNILKVLKLQIERAEARKKGHIIDYRKGELEYLVEVLKQIKDEYRALEYVGKPFGQSVIEFQKQVGAPSINFSSES